MQSPSQYILEGLLSALQAKQMSTGTSKTDREEQERDQSHPVWTITAHSR